MKEQTKAFVIAALIRAVRTFAQGIIGYIGGSAMVLGDVDWLTALSAGALAAIISLLMSVVTGLPEVSGDDVTE